MKNSKLKPILVGWFLASALWQPIVSSADDTEIFFARGSTSGSAEASNVLLMMDNSGSMNELDGGDETRMARIKNAVYELLDSSGNINMGVGAFNGFNIGGNILFPVRNLSDDLCPNYACDSLNVHSRFQHASDDATESADGTVSLNNEVLSMVGGADASIATGLRFPALNIPRGAKITDAQIVFHASAANSDRADLIIRAHASGDSPPFVAESGNISTRSKTASSVNWRASSFSNFVVPVASRDIRSVVEEIVHRDDWCGGNALSIIIEGTGTRDAIAFEHDRHLAPVLKVTYDPSTVDMADTCLAQRQRLNVEYSTDDAMELLSDGEINAVTPHIEVGGSNILTGLRFRGVEIPKNALISAAQLTLISTEDSSANVSIGIAGESTGFSGSFNPSIPSNLSDREQTSNSVRWDIDNVDEANAVHRSPDISAVIQDIVNSAGWEADNTLSLLLSGTGSGESRSVYSHDGDSTNSANLTISYQVESPQLSGNSVVLHEVRDEIRLKVGELRASTRTPLLDMYYEAAAYMRGDAVQYGRRRGDQQVNDRWLRLSHPESFSGGVLDRNPECLETNLNARECIDEEILGNPIYKTPIASSCQANQIVLVSDGGASSQSSADLIRDMTGVSACEPTGSNAASSEQCGYELAEFLNENDQSDQLGEQNIVTHTIGFNFTSEFLRTIATRGGGGFHEAQSASELSSVFRNIVRNVADVNSSFVAPGATVSQFNRLANRDDVYYAVFRPSLNPYWEGNLKRYELGKRDSDNTVSILDRDGDEVFDLATGLTFASAKSFWHSETDGGDVSRGGAVSQLDLSRNVNTAVLNSSGNLRLSSIHHTNSEITREMLGIESESDAYRTRLLQWARGVDVNDEDQDGDTQETRSRMGDPMHSQPALLNYESDLPDGDSVVFMGTNEGFLHAIDTSDGDELFAYMPPSLLSNIDILFNNLPNPDKPYGVDGNAVTWIQDADGDNRVDSTEDAYAIFGMRRGGNEYHALNVTDPKLPTLAWHIEGGVGDFAELGQTWSTPVKTQMRIGGEVKHVIVFGGGYDPVNDDREIRVSTDSVGRAIYIVDAVTGELIESITQIDNPNMEYSIPSKVSVLDMNSDGLADRFYVGDMGGQLWRFDITQGINEGDELGVTGGVIADLSVDDDLTNNRRFYYEPDVSLNSTGDQQYLGIAIGSGWRAHPLDAVVDERFYFIKDLNVFSPPRDEDDNIFYDTVDNDSLFDTTFVSVDSDTSSNSDNGWYINLADGEKVLSSPVTINSQLLFTTYIPETDVGVCSTSVGGGRLYVVDSSTALPVLDLSDQEGVEDRFKEIAIPGIPPSASILFPESDGGQPSLFVGTQRVSDEFDAGPLIRRTHWYESTNVD